MIAGIMVQFTAPAATIAYLDRSVWEANVVNTIEIDYEDPIATGGAGTILYDTAAGFSRSGVQVVGTTGSGYFLHGYRAGATQPWYNWGTGAILMSQPVQGDVVVRVNYTGGPTAIGLYLMTGTPTGSPVTVTVNGTDQYVVQTNSNPTPAWWGIAGTTPISYAEFRTSPGATIELDMLSTGQSIAPVTDTPELPSFLMCAVGLFTAGWYRFPRKSD